MASINLNVHLEYGEVVERLKAEGWVIPVRCKDCRHRDPEDHKCDCGEMERQGCPFPVDGDYYCAYGERKGGDERRKMIGHAKPPVDAVPVVRAAWQSWEQDKPPFKWYSCDYCGFHALSRSNYCPNCGADMREV